MSIIKNYAKRGYHFEQAIVELENRMLHLSQNSVIETELGVILLDTMPTIGADHPVQIWAWGNEPSARSVICRRHEKIDFYVQARCPMTMLHSSQRVVKTMAVEIMSEIFLAIISKKTLDGYSYRSQDANDHALLQYQMCHKVSAANVGIGAYVLAENTKGLCSPFRSTREATNQLISEIAHRRGDDARAIIDEDVYQAVHKNHIASVLNPYWSAMFCLAYQVHKDSPYTYGMSQALKVTAESVKQYFADHPDDHISECEAVIRMVTSNDFVPVLTAPIEEPKTASKGTRGGRRNTGRRAKTEGATGTQSQQDKQ